MQYEMLFILKTDTKAGAKASIERQLDKMINFMKNNANIKLKYDVEKESVKRISEVGFDKFKIILNDAYEKFDKLIIDRFKVAMYESVIPVDSYPDEENLAKFKEMEFTYVELSEFEDKLAFIDAGIIDEDQHIGVIYKKNPEIGPKLITRIIKTGEGEGTLIALINIFSLLLGHPGFESGVCNLHAHGTWRVPIEQLMEMQDDQRSWWIGNATLSQVEEKKKEDNLIIFPGREE